MRKDKDKLRGANDDDVAVVQEEKHDKRKDK